MDDDTKREWERLGEQLRELCPEKADEVMQGMRDLIEAQEIIRRYDWQLMFRGRPRKRYHA